MAIQNAPVAAPIASIAAAAATLGNAALPSAVPVAAPEVVAAPVNVAPVAEVVNVQANLPEGTPTEASAEATEPEDKLLAKIEAKKAQYVKLAAEIERLEQQHRAASRLSGVKAGSVIDARVGRAETSRVVRAAVLGVQTLDNGDLRFKVYYGEGMDAETAVIQTSQIVDVISE